MQNIVDVNTGEIAVHRGHYLLRSIAIGSCITLAAYDPRTKNAGMAHIMLPGQAPKSYPDKTKYAFDGINQMLRQMSRSGSVLRNIEVCLIGAGNVLRKEDDAICQSNIDSVTAILADKKIRIRSSVLGGYNRKSAFFDAETGHVSYTEGDGPTKLLWQFFAYHRQIVKLYEVKTSPSIYPTDTRISTD